MKPNRFYITAAGTLIKGCDNRLHYWAANHGFQETQDHARFYRDRVEAEQAMASAIRRSERGDLTWTVLETPLF